VCVSEGGQECLRVRIVPLSCALICLKLRVLCTYAFVFCPWHAILGGWVCECAGGPLFIFSDPIHASGSADSHKA
jgi:hypothetical protein